LLSVLSEQDTTFWVPIVMSGAGKNRGWFFIPEPDDEVLVLFEHGDVNRPVVVGALWNGKDHSPDGNPDPFTNDHRVIKSRQGSRVLLDDGGEPKVVIEDGAGKARITLDTKNNKIVIEALDGDVCFQSPQGDMKVVAKSADLKAQKNIEINAGSAMAWGTDGDAKIKSQNVTMSGAKVNLNCGSASAPEAPTADPKDVEDPYGS
jgi:uncharacterized protein involved in type VI secretion and phage assembly